MDSAAQCDPEKTQYNVYYDANSQKFKCSPNQTSCAENVCACDTEFVNS